MIQLKVSKYSYAIQYNQEQKTVLSGHNLDASMYTFVKVGLG